MRPYTWRAVQGPWHYTEEWLNHELGGSMTAPLDDLDFDDIDDPGEIEDQDYNDEEEEEEDDELFDDEEDSPFVVEEDDEG